MPNYAERYATARYHYAELCRIMLLCRLCRTHAIMPIYYAGIKGHAQAVTYRTIPYGCSLYGIDSSRPGGMNQSPE